MSRTSLAVLAVVAMLWMWSGAATADPLVPTAEECLADPALETCVGSGGDDPASDGTPGPEGDGTTGAEEGPEEPLEVLDPPQEFDDPNVTQPDIDRRVAATGAEGDSTAGAAEQESAAEEEDEEPSEEPDPAAVAECIANEVELLITSLEELLGDGFEEIADGIEEGAGSLDPTDPTALPEFLAGLPTMIEESGAEFTEEVAAAVRGSVEGIVACLPAPPEEPPGGNPPPEEPPSGQPVGHENPHYENCDDARAQGAAPVYEGEPGYGPHLDADDDGIGCEEETVVPVAHNTGGGQLAYTGTELGPQLTLGAVLLLTGGVLLLATRRRA